MYDCVYDCVYCASLLFYLHHVSGDTYRDARCGGLARPPHYLRLSSSRVTMSEITINLDKADVIELEMEKVEDGQKIHFLLEGVLGNCGGEIVQDAFEAQTIEPDSITVRTD